MLPPPVNQRVRRKFQNPTQYNYNRNNTYIGSLNDNRENNELFWEQQMYNYQDIKEEIAEKVTNHTNKLIDNIENKKREQRKKTRRSTRNCIRQT